MNDINLPCFVLVRRAWITHQIRKPVEIVVIIAVEIANITTAKNIVWGSTEKYMQLVNIYLDTFLYKLSISIKPYGNKVTIYEFIYLLHMVLQIPLLRWERMALPLYYLKIRKFTT